MDRFESYRAFVEVAEAASFTQAARRLAQSKSSISKAVAALEDDLAVRLFHRTTRRLSLTEAGAALLPRAREVLDRVAEAESFLAAAAESPRGTLRVAAPLSFGLQRLGPLLPGLLASCPDLKIELMLEDRRVDLVEEGVDVALRVGHLADSSLKALRLGAARMRLVAAPGFMQGRDLPHDPDALAGWPALLYSTGTGVESWTFSRGDDSRTLRPESRLVANNGDVLRDAAIAGLGLARLPGFLVDEALAAGTLTELLADWQPEPLPIHALYPPGPHQPLKLRAFLDHLRTHFRDGAPA